MRRAAIAAVVTTGMVLGAGRQASAQAFAGTAHYTIHDENGKTNTMTIATKPGHYAVQFTSDEGKAGELIVDSAAGTTTYVSSEDKSYFVITKEMMQGMAGMMSGMAGMMRRHGADSSKDDSDEPKATITPGGTSVVAGISCQVFHYVANDDKHTTGDVCLAKGAGMGLLNLNPMGGMMGGMGMQPRERRGIQDRLRRMGQVGQMLQQGYGILKATSFEDGKPKGSIEVTSVERGTPPDAAFAPPPGYTEKNMGDMMRGGRRP
jgi:hypothetical protein